MCIYQGNVGERNQQVQRMRDIYRYAREVVVWLGEYDDPSDDTTVFRPDVWGFTKPPAAKDGGLRHEANADSLENGHFAAGRNIFFSLNRPY